MRLLLVTVVVCGAVAPLPAPVRLGTIDFPTSGPSAAQAQFVEGVLYLHSFEYASAAAAFRRAQALAPAFAMVYWGEAIRAGARALATRHLAPSGSRPPGRTLI